MSALAWIGPQLNQPPGPWQPPAPGITRRWTAPSKIRMKLFTLDNRLIVRKIGRLSDQDTAQARKQLQALFDLP